MPLNNKPIFVGVPKISWYTTGSTNILKTANVSNAIIPENYKVFTADATYGSYVQKIRFRPIGTNIATVARVFINNGSIYTTQANNIIYDEISIPATTVSNTSALPLFEISLNLALPPGFAIYVSLGTTVAAGFDVSIIGGDYSANAA